MPANKGESKKNIRAESYGMYEHIQDEYDQKRNYDFFMSQASKAQRLHGDFKKSNFFDNGTQVNEFGLQKLTLMKSKKRGVTAVNRNEPSEDDAASTDTTSLSASMTAQQRARMSNQQFEGNKNKFQTFLNEKTELPRLSILDNYK